MEAIKESEGRSKGGKVLDKWIADLAVRWPCRILLHYAGSRSLKFSMHTWLRRNAVAPDVSEFGCALQAGKWAIGWFPRSRK
jgi:hypothetical protein